MSNCSCLPPSYLNAELRGVLPVCPDRKRVGLAFDMPDGGVVRVALTPDCMRSLIGAAEAYMSSCAGTQSSGSLESPSLPGSVPSGIQNV